MFILKEMNKTMFLQSLHGYTAKLLKIFTIKILTFSKSLFFIFKVKV